MTKSRNKQRENRRKFTKEDRLSKKTIADARDTTPYFAMFNLTLDPCREAARYI